MIANQINYIEGSREKKVSASTELKALEIMIISIRHLINKHEKMSRKDREMTKNILKYNEFCKKLYVHTGSNL